MLNERIVTLSLPLIGFAIALGDQKEASIIFSVLVILYEYLVLRGRR